MGAAHGHAGNPEKGIPRSPTYLSWQHMIARCTQRSNPAYEHYKARGITVCERWRSFVNFLADMGERPSRAHTLDREDNDGNYEPGNCRWATMREQGNNRSTNRTVNYNGEMVTFAELARITGAPKELLRHRLLRGRVRYASVDEAIAAPRRPGRRAESAYRA